MHPFPSSVVLTLFLPLALAKGRGGGSSSSSGEGEGGSGGSGISGGSGGGPSFGDGGSGGSAGDGGGDGGSDSGFSLAPMDAAHFAFCIIFGVVTAIQALQALRNMRRPPTSLLYSATHPFLETTVGSIFPGFLLASTLCLVASYVLHAVFWGRTNNLSALESPDFNPAFFDAWFAMGPLANIFLVNAILGLLSHWDKTYLDTSQTIRRIKGLFDWSLVYALLALSMAFVGLGVGPAPTPNFDFLQLDLRSIIVTAEHLNFDYRLLLDEGLRSSTDIEISESLRLAYISLFLVTVVDIAVSSLVLCPRLKRLQPNDSTNPLHVAFIISPLLIVSAVFLVVNEAAARQLMINPLNGQQWALAGLIIDGVTKAIVIQVCLRFGRLSFPNQISHLRKGEEKW